MRIVMDSKEIEMAYKKVGDAITSYLEKEEKLPILLCVMKGAMTFLVGMAKYIKTPVIYDYIHLSSYDGTSSTGEVKLLKEMTFDPQDRVVIIVEDVLDTGISMDYLYKHLQQFKPKEIKIACFVDKPARRENSIKPDFVGATYTKNEYLCGNGFDYNDIGRNIPFVFVPEDEDFRKWDETLKKDPLRKL